jgi:hypothetical protein
MSDERRLLEARRSKRVFGAVALSLAAAVAVGGVTIALMKSETGPSSSKPPSSAAAISPNNPSSGTNAEPSGQPGGQVIDLASLPDSPTPSTATAEAGQPATAKPVTTTPTPATPTPTGATADPQPTATAAPIAPTATATVASGKPETKPKPVDTSVPVVQTPGF